MAVLAAEAGRKLTLEFPPAGGLLEITIHRDGGETVIHLVNSGFTDKADWEDEFLGIRHGSTMARAVLPVRYEKP